MYDIPARVEEGGRDGVQAIVTEESCVFACSLLSENKERDVNSTPAASRKGSVEREKIEGESKWIRHELNFISKCGYTLYQLTT